MRCRGLASYNKWRASFPFCLNTEAYLGTAVQAHHGTRSSRQEVSDPKSNLCEFFQFATSFTSSSAVRSDLSQPLCCSSGIKIVLTYQEVSRCRLGCNYISRIIGYYHLKRGGDICLYLIFSLKIEQLLLFMT